MKLKLIDEHVRYPAKAGISKIILSAHQPAHLLGNLRDSIFQSRYVQFVDELVRMDALPAVALLSTISYNFVREQLRSRPRIKLVAATKLLLVGLLALSSFGVNQLSAKKNDIKVNGQAVLVAEEKLPNNNEAQLDASISFKENPLDYKMPVEGYISQGYRGYHRAIDIATGRTGVPILPLGAGTVEFAGYLADGKGNTVIVNHGDGLKSLYAHMGNIKVKSGQKVESSTAIGTVGMTGRTTGAHVHLEIYDNDIAVDPEKVLPKVDNPLGLAPKTDLDSHSDSDINS